MLARALAVMEEGSFGRDNSAMDATSSALPSPPPAFPTPLHAAAPQPRLRLDLDWAVNNMKS
jgi:hypothetical protein